MTKTEVLKIIDEVMNNREIDSIRNAILAIRDKVIDFDEATNIVTLDESKPIWLELRGNNRLCEASPWFDGARYVCIDPWEKIDTGLYGCIHYAKEKW